MLDNNSVVDSVMTKVMDVTFIIIKSITSFIFSSWWITILFWIIGINLVAIFLMKKDKSNAENGARRIRESTLLSTALVGGAIRNVLCDV